jgi:hypothetical protein
LIELEWEWNDGFAQFEENDIETEKWVETEVSTQSGSKSEAR